VRREVGSRPAPFRLKALVVMEKFLDLIDIRLSDLASGELAQPLVANAGVVMDLEVLLHLEGPPDDVLFHRFHD
jgi:hypothetical protein